MVRIRRVRTAAIVAFAVFGMACSSGGSNSSSQTGQFVDSMVQGLGHVGDSYSGTTDALGQYQYNAGDEVCFFLGTIPLGCGEAAGLFTPIDLFDGADWDDCRVLNVVRFMLSLDADSDPDNGIDLRGIETVAADAEAFDFGDCDNFDTDVAEFIDDWGNGPLVDEEGAMVHFDASLDEVDYFEQVLLGSWMYTAFELSGPSGVRALDISDQTLDEISANVSSDGEITFELDGEGPGEVCTHYGELESKVEEYIFGGFECGGDQEVAALVESESTFRMDRLDPSVDYATSDLLGSWFVLTGFSDYGALIDEDTLTESSASVSASGAVSLQAATDLGQEGEICQFDGQMNSFKSFISGSLSCPESGDDFFTMEMNQFDQE